MVSDLFFAFLATLILIFGILAKFLIIIYLKRKYPISKTSFDQSVIDMITSSMVFGISIYLFGSFYVSNASFSFYFTTVFTFFFVGFSQFFIVSCFVTLIIKYIHVFYGHWILEVEDKKVRFWALFTKLVLVGFYMSLDQFGMIQHEPAPFILLLPQENKR